jgi:hypothetical protein
MQKERNHIKTTSAGIVDHEEGRQRHTGGKILGFFFLGCKTCIQIKCLKGQNKKGGLGGGKSNTD